MVNLLGFNINWVGLGQTLFRWDCIELIGSEKLQCLDKYLLNFDVLCEICAYIFELEFIKVLIFGPCVEC